MDIGTLVYYKTYDYTPDLTIGIVTAIDNCTKLITVLWADGVELTYTAIALVKI